MNRRPVSYSWETRDFRPAAQTITYRYATATGSVALPLAGFLVQTRTEFLDGLDFTEPAPGQPPQDERPVRIAPAVLDPDGHLIAADDPGLGDLDGISAINFNHEEN